MTTITISINPPQLPGLTVRVCHGTEIVGRIEVDGIVHEMPLDLQETAKKHLESMAATLESIRCKHGGKHVPAMQHNPATWYYEWRCTICGNLLNPRFYPAPPELKLPRWGRPENP